jgi:hypothetical protein
MTEEISYYAIVNDFSSREQPGGVLRRIKHDGGERDETFGSDLKWGRSALLYSYERGDLTNEMIPISEDEAERIVARIKEAFGAGSLPTSGIGRRSHRLILTRSISAAERYGRVRSAMRGSATDSS